MGLLYNTAKTGFLNPINKTVDGLIGASNGLMCLKNSIFGLANLNPASILGGLASMAAGMINAIVSSVTKVIYKRVGQIVNSVLSPIRQLENLINDITNVLVDVQDTLNRATNINNYFKDKQDCSTMGVDLMNCLAQSAINKISNKIAMDVDKFAGGIANSVAKEAFKVNGIISNNIKRQADFLNKATLQNKLLT